MNTVMENPSDITVETYRRNFDKYVERTPAVPSIELTEWMDCFLAHILQGGMILEIGSATGRDARYLSERGYVVMCTDVIGQALQKLSEEGFETAEFDFRDEPKREWIGKFDGVFANAVLLHAPLDVFEDALGKFATVLKEGGVVAFSLKTGAGEEITLEKMDAPRYFRYYTEPEIREVLRQHPFEIISISHTNSGRWMDVILRARRT
jgi:SAM-dependent methyltransferase